MSLIESLRKRVEGIKAVVTHTGSMHRDEFMVCAIMAYLGRVMIYRHEPGDYDKANLETMVVDIGGVHDVSRLLFDHHQLSDEPPRCALTLVLDWLGILEDMRGAFSWVDLTARMDCRGPYAAASYMRISPRALFQTISPVETAILDSLGRATVLGPGDPMYYILVTVGGSTLEYLERFQERLSYLKRYAAITSVGPIKVITLDEPVREPSLAMDAFRASLDDSQDVAVIVTPDDRSGGTTLYRPVNHPAISFSRISDDRRVLFAHQSGFLAKLVGGLGAEDINELIQLSLDPNYERSNSHDADCDQNN